MASYLRSWLVSPSDPSSHAQSIPGSFNDEDDDNDHDDTPPAFPALNSIQRSTRDNAPTILPPRSPSPDTLRMPPPPLPSLKSLTRAGLNAPTSSNSLLPPPSTVQRMPNTNTKSKARAKVALTPGHSPLDWARLKSSGEDLRVRMPLLYLQNPLDIQFGVLIPDHREE